MHRVAGHVHVGDPARRSRCAAGPPARAAARPTARPAPQPPVQRHRCGVDRRDIGHAGPAAVLVVVDRVGRPPAGPLADDQQADRGRTAEGAGPAGQDRPAGRSGSGRPGPVPRWRPAPPARRPAGRPRPPPRTAAGCRPRGSPTCRRPAATPGAATAVGPLGPGPAGPGASTPTATCSPCVRRGRQHRGMIDSGGDDPRARSGAGRSASPATAACDGWAPEAVKTTSSGRAPTASATTSRARSSACAASRPGRCNRSGSPQPACCADQPGLLCIRQHRLTRRGVQEDLRNRLGHGRNIRGQPMNLRPSHR